MNQANQGITRITIPNTEDRDTSVCYTRYKERKKKKRKKKPNSTFEMSQNDNDSSDKLATNK
jgi:hypothetical protein